MLVRNAEFGRRGLAVALGKSTGRRGQPQRWIFGRDWWRTWQGLIYVSPWLVGFILLYAAPFVVSIVLSFSSWTLVDFEFVGVRNYVELFTDDERFTHSLINTLYYAVLHVPSVMLMGFGAALLLHQRVKLLGVFRTLFYLPAITPGAATAVLFAFILSPYGLVNSLLEGMGVPRELVPGWFSHSRWAMPSLVITGLWGFGPTMILYLAALQGIPQHLYDAAKVDGAGRWQLTRHVTIPLMTPVIFFTLIIGMIGSLTQFQTALVATEGGPDDATLFTMLYMYQLAWRFFRFGYGSAVAWIAFLLILGFTILQFWAARRWVYYEGAEQR